MDIVGSLLTPPRLTVRALDDIHRLAVATATIVEMQKRMDDRLTRVERQLDAIIDFGGELTKMDRRGLELLGRALDDLGNATTSLTAIADPLRGATDRIGKIAERLPKLGG